MHSFLLRQKLSLPGALLILTAYAGEPFDRMDVRRVASNLRNGIGSAPSAVSIAFHPLQIGLLPLELSWILMRPYALACIGKHQ